MNYSPEQVIALAPDAASAKAGRSLANTSKWASLGQNERAVWGECRGSGKDPYQTEIDLNEPAFKCTCPSRKFPCKHGLGLFLLFAAQPSIFKDTLAPAWVTEWLLKRDQQAERKKTEEGKKERPEAQAATESNKETGKAKRTLDRHAKVAAGLGELELWLRDLVRQGLAAVQSQPARYWEQMAARLVDAQAPGVARRLREMSSLPQAGDGWTEILLAQLGSLYLLAEGYNRIETLPLPVQADIRTAIGWTHKEEDLLSGDGLRDHWLILGQRTTEEEGLRVQRTWLQGQQSASSAVVLDFAFQGRPLSVSLMPGSCVDAELVFYPGKYPLRAVIKKRFAAPNTITALSGYETCDQLLDGYAEGLARNPWLETFPAPLEAVVPLQRGESWFVRDATERLLPLSRQFTERWKLLSLSGGHPQWVFGEWNGRALLPLSAWAEGRYVEL